MSDSDSIDVCAAVEPAAHVGGKRGRAHGSRLAVRTVGSFAVVATQHPCARWENGFELDINELGYRAAGHDHRRDSVVLAQCKAESSPLDEPLPAKLRKVAGKGVRRFMRDFVGFASWHILECLSLEDVTARPPMPGLVHTA